MSIYDIDNEDGIKHVDADQLPLVLRKKVVLDVGLASNPRRMGGNTASTTIVWYVQAIDIGSTPDAVIAFSGRTYAKVQSIAGSTAYIAYQRSAGDTLEVYVFGSGATGTAASIFAMWTADGTLSFTAEDLPMRPVGGLTYAIAGQPLSNASISVPGVKLAGILVSSAQVNSSENDENNQSNDRRYIGQSFIQAFGGTVSFDVLDYVTLRVPVDGNDQRALNTGTLVAIDVTNY